MQVLVGDIVLSIHQLWVHEDFRHKGYGTKLLVKVEGQVKSLGAKLAHLDSLDFQAIDFYKKHGYVTFGILNDCPCAGHKRYYMKKEL